MLALIIDDDIEVMELLSSFLEQNGLDVVKSFTAEDGMKKFQTHHPEVTFLDIMLPDKSGLNLLKEMKKCNKNAPVIMVTGFKDAENVVTAFREGAFDCLLKPFNYEYLKNDILTRLKTSKK